MKIFIKYTLRCELSVSGYKLYFEPSVKLPLKGKYELLYLHYCKNGESLAVRVRLGCG